MTNVVKTSDAPLRTLPVGPGHHDGDHDQCDTGRNYDADDLNDDDENILADSAVGTLAEMMTMLVMMTMIMMMIKTYSQTVPLGHW